MKYEELTIDSKNIYKNKVLDVYEDTVVLPNNKKGKREWIKHPGGVAILPIIGDEIIMVEQYRYPLRKTMLEIPAGKLEINEDHYAAGLRELNEEIGMKAQKLIYLGDVYPAIGYSNEIIYLYYCDNMIQDKMNLDEDEFLDVKRIKLSECIKMINNNEICDSKTVAAVFRYLLIRGEKNDCKTCTK